MPWGGRTVPHPDSIRGSRGRRKLRLGQSGVQTILWPQAIGEAGIRANACIVAPVLPTNLLDSVPLASGSSVIQGHDATQKLMQDQRVSRRALGQGENSPREGRPEDPRHSQWRPRRKARLIRQEPHLELHGNMHAATPSPKPLQMYSQRFSVGLSQDYETSSP